MQQACQTLFSFLSKEQVAVCLKNKELHFRIISYSYTKQPLFMISSVCTRLFSSWSWVSLLPTLCTTLRNKGVVSGGPCLFLEKTPAASQLLHQA